MTPSEPAQEEPAAVAEIVVPVVAEIEVPVPAEMPKPDVKMQVDVRMQVADIRDLVAGKVTTPEPTQAAEEVEEDEDEEELDDDKEYEYYYEDEDDNEVIVGTSAAKDGSLEALLADARRMRKSGAENQAARRMRKSDAENQAEPEEPTIVDGIKSVLSTIVTAGFFLVCALLAWFVLGFPVPIFHTSRMILCRLHSMASAGSVLHISSRVFHARSA